MITDDPRYHWIYIVPSDPAVPYKGRHPFPKTREEYLEYRGKWIVMDKRMNLDILAIKLNPYVEDRYINTIKYDREPLAFMELGDTCVMCVFCDYREREQVWEILAHEGVTEKVWVFERQTIEMWMPGGMIIEKLISYFKLNPEDAETLRKECRERWEKWLSYLFEGGYKDDEGIWNFEQIRV